ncbi:UDP-glucose--hexose-1-phosphate uridylyltransferase [Robertmurraya yapensis]|uniref:Galactose-1-phosphate uridylyltransferase n=2 Tax=Bacillaceae TaxID=186817 RepID=A0A3S0KTD3_9BACI|nr:UDP-glucose--hexose-1-phosphate uridylyltransferase [Bacillus yapensis]RTR33978.1 UDP-glucose--hexose-1-phosphate uridylyltransferase [Bacillus yapensis]TKS97296.1 UDP-glucose--hexose-1-phosphate uridylyltransferase [Bacillus yapensis]
MNIHDTVQQFTNQAVKVQLIEQGDVVYGRNQILSLLGLESFEPTEVTFAEKEIPTLLENLIEYAIANGICDDYFDAKEIFASKIMNTMMPLPSTVTRRFYDLYKYDPVAATNFFYELSKNSNYIQMQRIEKNIEYRVDTEYGELDITINLSKPEKDPKQIALEREQKPKETNYPKCLLCVENEGYAGRIGHPARSNHRIIPVEVAEEKWFLQYSPYVYYNEHCILLCEEHRDMKISRETFARLLGFVEQFPHYFIGSNADIPIVGGSILSHDHYQGGNYEFAMARAEDEFTFEWTRFPAVEFSTVKWPMSVLRLRSEDIRELVEAGDAILQSWKKYSDPDVDIYAFSGETPHNTITPIARKREEKYELDLVLRNNRTSDEHHLGIFHPHADVHHIKKENIGLIEVMGLAVLPARLETELVEVERFVLDEPNSIDPIHLPWAEELKRSFSGTSDDIQDFVKHEVGKKFLRALEDAGVYKRDEKGQAGFRRFINTSEKTPSSTT